MKKLFLIYISLIIVPYISYGQEFLRRTTHQPMSFQEMQRNFDEWSKTKSLNDVKYWKYFKRWEMDQQFHTDGAGNPGDPAVYIHEIIKASSTKRENNSNRFSASTWSPVGPNIIPQNQTGYMENGIGRINCIAFDPINPATYYAGVAQGGLWKTTNNGQTWTPLTDNLPITRISDIEIDPTNPNTIYISVGDFEYIGFGLLLNGKKRNTHYGLGVYKTTDGGQTWNPTGLSFQLTQGDASLIRKVIVHPTNNNILVACGTSGMYRSNDAGITWSHPLDSLFWDLQQDPVNPDILYAATGWVATANDGNAAIYKSTDFGISWTMLNTGIPSTGTVQRVKLAIAPSDPNIIYASTVDIDFGFYGLYKSTNAGATWSYITPVANILESYDGTGTGGQGNYDLGFTVNAQDPDIIYSGGINIWASDDGGFNFNPVSHWTTGYGPTLHGDIHMIATQPQTGNVFVCSDGGLYRTGNIIAQSWLDAYNGIPWPTQWSNLSNGMAVTSFYRLSSSKNTTGRLIAGAQDNATFYFDGNSWSTVIGGDGMDNYLDPIDNNLIIGSSQFGYFSYSQDGGLTYNGLNNNPNFEVGEWTTPFVADLLQPGTMYSGFNNVSKSDDGGNNWTMISNFPASGIYNNEISALAVSHSNSNYIYAAKRVRYEYSSPGSMYMTNNGGGSWIDITAGIPDSLYYTSVDVSQTQPQTAYVSLAGFSAGNKIFRTINGGTSWSNISYNLPNLPVNCIKTIPGSNKIIAATDIGIYILGSASTSWTIFSQGLPNVIVTDIEFNPALNKTYVSTFGRGIWEIDLDVLTGNPQIFSNDFKADLYPTINNGNFIVKLSGIRNKKEKIKLNIIDVKGSNVVTKELQSNETNEISVQLPSGIYFARLNQGKSNLTKKFIIE